MAEFEDNPFADPKQINPFADPSVQQASTPQAPTEEYNPFAAEAQSEPELPKLPPPPTKEEVKKKEKEKKEKKQKKKPEGPKRPFAEPPPAVLQPEPPYEPPPSYEPAPSQFGGGDDQLRQREEELARREAELKDREKNLQKLGVEARPKNFPPLPKFCPCQPCMYINIAEEIPPGERWKVRIIVALLAYYFVMLVLNLIMSFTGLVAFGASDNQNPTFTGTHAVLTIVFGFVLILICPVLALFCWFFPLYYAYRKDSSLAFMWFFFILPAQCLFWLIFALGIGGFTCGFISGAGLFQYANSSHGNVIGGMWIALGFLWMIPIPVAAFLVFIVHRYYRSSGGSINKAMGEAVTGAAKNEAVRGAVKSSVKAGVSAAMDKE